MNCSSVTVNESENYNNAVFETVDRWNHLKISKVENDENSIVDIIQSNDSFINPVIKEIEKYYCNQSPSLFHLFFYIYYFYISYYY